MNITENSNKSDFEIYFSLLFQIDVSAEPDTSCTC